MAPKVPVTALSPSHIPLLAIHLASSSDVPGLLTLRDTLQQAYGKNGGGNGGKKNTLLSPEMMLRVLLFLPESLAPGEYVELVEGVLNGSGSGAEEGKRTTPPADGKGTTTTTTTIDTSPVSSLSEGLAQRRLERLLEGIPTFDCGSTGSAGGGGNGDSKTAASAVTQWLLVRSRNIDTETGMLSLVQELLFPFMQKLPAVAAYFAGTVQVLSRLVYDGEAALEAAGSGEKGMLGGGGGGGYGDGDGDRDGEGVEGSGQVGGGREGGWFVRGLVQFEALSVASAVKYLLLQTSKETVVKDIVTLVSPYLRFRELPTRLEGWRVLWEWLVAKDLRTVFEVYMNWDGPLGTEAGDDVSMQEYASTGMAACYLCKDATQEHWEMMKKIQGRIVEVFGLRNIQLANPAAGKFDKAKYAECVRLKPTSKDLLANTCLLTRPTVQSLDLLGYLVSASSVLGLPLYATAQIRITGTKEDQKALLTRYVRQGNNWTKRNEQEWRHVIDASRWMRASAGVFEMLTEQECEEILVRGLLSATKFKMVEDIYVQDPKFRKAIGVHRLEEVILEAFLEFYDNASNGNMTRGGMRNAHLTLQILFPAHSNSPAILRAHRLLKATHALSFYSLTLTPGVPLLPVQIRINPDPVSLLGRLLDQNSSSYLQLDKLVPLAKDLHHGTAPLKATRTQEEERTEDEHVERRVLGMCIESALAEDDFDTAYSLTKSRLKTPEGKTTTSNNNNNNTNNREGANENDESAWKACFQAGRYRSHSQHPQRRAGGDSDLLKRLEMQMELLAEALRSCPAVACNQVLAEWMRKESELAEVLAREMEQDEAHARGLGGAGGMTSSTSSIMSGTTTSSRAAGGDHHSRSMSTASTAVGDSEAPMGLFAVAAGAAKALGSTVRPLGGGGGGAGVARSATGTPRPGDGSSSLMGSPPSSPPQFAMGLGGSPQQQQQQRRKRDIVGGMVTSSLASGLGWVLGAQPVVNSNNNNGGGGGAGGR